MGQITDSERDKKGRFKTGGKGGPGRGNRKPGVDVPEGADLLEIAKKVVEDGMLSQDEKMRLRAASLASKFQAPNRGDARLSGEIQKIFDFLLLLAGDRTTNIFSLIDRMSRICPGCEKLGPVYQEARLIDPDREDLESE